MTSAGKANPTSSLCFFLALSWRLCHGAPYQGLRKANSTLKHGEVELTELLNGWIAADESESPSVYTVGRGVIFRNMNDGFADLDFLKVRPGSLISNDIFTPNIVYNLGAADCGKNLGNQACAVVGTIYWGDEIFQSLFLGDTMADDYELGVFYAVDSNAVDERARFEGDSDRYEFKPFTDKILDQSTGFFNNPGSDNPDFQRAPPTQVRGTAEFEFGNPYKIPTAGGGTGMHACFFDPDQDPGTWFTPTICQIRSSDGSAQDIQLIQNGDAQCYAEYFTDGCNPKAYSGYKEGTKEGNCWENWIEHWVKYSGGQINPGSDNLNNGLRDLSACWHTNFRAMINLQNWFWLKASDWTSAQNPETYWGWNEIPLTSTIVQDVNEIGNIAIALPAYAGSDADVDLTDEAKNNLAEQLQWYIEKKYLIAKKDGRDACDNSNIVFLQQLQRPEAKTNYKRQFSCMTMAWFGGTNRFQTKYEPPVAASGFGGACCLYAP